MCVRVYILGVDIPPSWWLPADAAAVAADRELALRAPQEAWMHVEQIYLAEEAVATQQSKGPPLLCGSATAERSARGRSPCSLVQAREAVRPKKLAVETSKFMFTYSRPRRCSPWELRGRELRPPLKGPPREARASAHEVQVARISPLATFGSENTRR